VNKYKNSPQFIDYTDSKAGDADLGPFSRTSFGLGAVHIWRHGPRGGGGGCTLYDELWRGGVGGVFTVGRHKALHKRHQVGYVGNYINFF
jgi:hypothetical protein